MLGELLVFLSLGALAIFILWEGWQRRRTSNEPLRRSVMEQGFVPGASSREVAIFVGAGVSAVFGFVLMAVPPHPPFFGRHAFISSLLFEWFGVWGMPMVCWLLAFVAFFGALAMRRKRLRGST